MSLRGINKRGRCYPSQESAPACAAPLAVLLQPRRGIRWLCYNKDAATVHSTAGKGIRWLCCCAKRDKVEPYSTAVTGE